MVTQGIERKPKPTYALTRIKELAAQRHVIYASKRVQYDTDAFSYDFDSVCKCLGELEERDFHESVLYSGGKRWLDVYRMSYQGPVDQVDDLYIKLKLEGNSMVVVLCSFHPERNS